MKLTIILRKPPDTSAIIAPYAENIMTERSGYTRKALFEEAGSGNSVRCRKEPNTNKQ